MDYLEEIINSLDRAEKKEFQHFIQRNKKRAERKDLALFKLYDDPPLPSVKKQMALLEIPNSNAYYGTRKRLYAHLSDFAILKANEEDQSAGSRVRGWYNIATHLFDRGLDKLAWNMLEKGRELAKKNDLFAELNAIYLLQIKNLHRQNEWSLFELTRAYERNQKLLRSDEKMILFHADLRQNMHQLSQSHMDVDLRMVLRRLMTQNNLEMDITQSPRLLTSVLETIRDSAKMMRQYDSFEKMATTLYAGLIDKTRAKYNVEILYMISHARYRNKRFAEALESLTSTREELLRCSKTMQRQVNLRIALLHAANALFLKGPQSAIEILSTLMEEKLSSVQESNAIVNLSTYHFYNEDFKSALRSMNSLKHSDSWYLDKMGEEWLLKQKMIELLIVHELGEVDLFESRERAIQRKFKSLLKQEKYQRAKAFLSLTKSYHNRLYEIDLDLLAKKTEVSWTWLPKEQEDLQAMMFYAWLKSKVVGQPCFDTLRGLVRS